MQPLLPGENEGGRGLLPEDGWYRHLMLITDSPILTGREYPTAPISTSGGLILSLYNTNYTGVGIWYTGLLSSCKNMLIGYCFRLHNSLKNRSPFTSLP